DDADAEFNAVDASLWYCVVVGEFLSAGGGEDVVSSAERTKLLDAVEAILEGYAAGARYRIGLDKDGLVAAGVPDKQLTWMDAKVGDWVVTPRVGKPVEIQALWLNALKVSRNFETRWAETFRRGSASFLTEYWDEGLGRGETEAGGGLVDVVDAEHIAGQTDRSIRPNQLFAAGGLPVMLVPAEKARRVVDLCERLLWTPHGMRTLAPADPGYRGRYAGGVLERDAATHLVSGDVLFRGGIGRTDFPDGDFEALRRSIHDELFAFADDAIVYPGHGEATTVGEERATNPYVGRPAGYSV
ncbi:MAG: amylo-alpha-1,6-glucosidase, partial [Planctomycetota bacterium]